MGISAISGPHLVYGQTKTSSSVTGNPTEYNEERAPSLYDLGYAIMDPRGAYDYNPGSAVGTPIRGWYLGRGIVDAMPTTLDTSCIAPSQSSTAAGATAISLTLNTTATGNITPGVTMSNPPDQTAAVTGLTVIDSTGALQGLTFGSGGTVKLWDPQQSIARAVRITVTLTLSTQSTFDKDTIYTVTGRDLYGYKMTETITGTSGNSSQAKTYTGQKAFKYISGVTVTPSAAAYTGSTGIAVGVADIFGMPLRADAPAYCRALAGPSTAQVTLSASTYFTLASTTTQTSTTTDVRGTWLSSVASSTSGAVKLFFEVIPSAQNVQSIGNTDVSGLVGLNQYSSI